MNKKEQQGPAENKVRVTIGPSLTGHENLHWFALGPELASGQDIAEIQDPEATEAIVLLQRRDPKLSGKESHEERPAIVLRLEGFRTEKELHDAMIQAENDFLFGTPDVGTMTIKEETRLCSGSGLSRVIHTIPTVYS
jgi:hypothetical protein